MKMYIANVTKQTQVVCYRLDFDKDGDLKDTNRRFSPYRQQDIPPGRQVQLGGDMHMNQIQEIQDQLTPYGLVAAKDAKSGSLGQRVVPLVFNVDVAVPAEVMRRVQAFNSGILIEQGRERRAKAAVASHQLITDTVSQQFMAQNIPAEPEGPVTVGFEQMEQSELGEKPIAEGYRVDPKAPPSAPGVRAGRRRRGK